MGGGYGLAQLIVSGLGRLLSNMGGRSSPKPLPRQFVSVLADGVAPIAVVSGGKPPDTQAIGQGA